MSPIYEVSSAGMSSMKRGWGWWLNIEEITQGKWQEWCSGYGKIHSGFTSGCRGILEGFGPALCPTHHRRTQLRECEVKGPGLGVRAFELWSGLESSGSKA